MRHFRSTSIQVATLSTHAVDGRSTKRKSHEHGQRTRRPVRQTPKADGGMGRLLRGGQCQQGRGIQAIGSERGLTTGVARTNTGASTNC